jgi:hypothetical protein
MADGRCRMHGSASTRPRAPAGLGRLRVARTRHGRYAREALAGEAGLKSNGRGRVTNSCEPGQGFATAARRIDAQHRCVRERLRF